MARAEARRGAGDPLYGYYTLGKLAIRKLRTDYATARGSQYSLKDFHDRFMQLGPLPLPLVREAMLGAQGLILAGKLLEEVSYAVEILEIGKALLPAVQRHRPAEISKRLAFPFARVRGIGNADAAGSVFVAFRGQIVALDDPLFFELPVPANDEENGAIENPRSKKSYKKK